ncbi:unnamed protein product (mitochondrion) [Plasmodiophora brassicae]|uniref:Uncharacterized protein n=1 Tax=Plasmodiophora brassicae TaxID=37360 RepID=A0A0G4IXB8_PLABS|nr:hypothetical protein PBRA_007709 [Plasmodiophora brassicae]SPQ99015.1 unnamed protein product [Plasmodiophora brassicae]
MIARIVLVIVLVGGVFGKTAPRMKSDVPPSSMLAGAALSGAAADRVSRALLTFLLLKYAIPKARNDILWKLSSFGSKAATSWSTVASSAATHTAAYVMYHEALRKTGSPLLATLSGTTGLIAGHAARFVAHTRYTPPLSPRPRAL